MLGPSQLRRDAETAPKVSAILGAHMNYGATLSPDGERTVFRSDRAGIDQLFVAEVAHPEQRRS